MIKVGIVGGTGYTGVELLRLLARHEQVELVCITSRSEAGKPVNEIFPSLHGLTLRFTAPDASRLAECECVFFATPNGTAMTMVPQLIDAGTRIIDLAADFRLRDIPTWRQWYGMEHSCPEYVQSAVYGLPEQNRQRIQSARLVANPGCYPTAVSLGWLPLLEKNALDVDTLIADAKSGVSGAGRKAQLSMLLAEAGENVNAYGVLGHRHEPEIEQILTQAGGKPVSVTFVPHLMPMARGMLATLYAGCELDEQDIRSVYRQRYKDEPFVHVLPAGQIPHTRSVRGSNMCQMAVQKKGGLLVVLSVIDNLTKGAAGQAVQNFNIMHGLPESTGLPKMGLVP